MTKIELRIPNAKLQQLQHEIHIGSYALSELRKAGVPVIGVLFPKWVDNGSLTLASDAEGLLFTWVGDEPLQQPVKQQEESIW